MITTYGYRWLHISVCIYIYIYTYYYIYISISVHIFYVFLYMIWYMYRSGWWFSTPVPKSRFCAKGYGHTNSLLSALAWHAKNAWRCERSKIQLCVVPFLAGSCKSCLQTPRVVSISALPLLILGYPRFQFPQHLSWWDFMGIHLINPSGYTHYRNL